MYPIVIFLLLLANWIVFSGKFDAFHLGLGVVSSCLLPGYHDLLFRDRKKSWEERMREAGAFTVCALANCGNCEGKSPCFQTGDDCQGL